MRPLADLVDRQKGGQKQRECERLIGGQFRPREAGAKRAVGRLQPEVNEGRVQTAAERGHSKRARRVPLEARGGDGLFRFNVIGW